MYETSRGRYPFQAWHFHTGQNRYKQIWCDNSFKYSKLKNVLDNLNPKSFSSIKDGPGFKCKTRMASAPMLGQSISFEPDIFHLCLVWTSPLTMICIYSPLGSVSDEFGSYDSFSNNNHGKDLIKIISVLEES